jgi:histidinol-phosphatase (PHP family)
MIANYHTHTVRCRHARGTERAYIEEGISNGLQVLGFSDHAPYLFNDPDGYYSTMRMHPGELYDYCDTLLQLREEYKDEIQILIGLEMEYYPAHFQRTLNWLKEFPLDYLILGQHFLGNEKGDRYCGGRTDSETQLKRYVDQVIDGLHTGCFTYLAHPDLPAFTGSDEVYGRHMTRLCKALRKLDIPAELNLLGLMQGRAYPDPRFWAIAAETGCRCILGCYAHTPMDTAEPMIIAEGEEFLAQFGMKPEPTAVLKNPFVNMI